MIEFPCRCGRYNFSVPTEMAGDSVQCPECRRLIDVPLMSDLAAMEDDGSLKLGAKVETPSEAEVVRKAMRAFTRERFDEHGNEIDMRATFDDVLHAHDPAPPRVLPVERVPED